MGLFPQEGGFIPAGGLLKVFLEWAISLSSMKNTRPNNKSLPAYYSRGLFALLGTLVITTALGMAMSASSAKAVTVVSSIL